MLEIAKHHATERPRSDFRVHAWDGRFAALDEIVDTVVAYEALFLEVRQGDPAGRALQLRIVRRLLESHRHFGAPSENASIFGTLPFTLSFDHPTEIETLEGGRSWNWGAPISRSLQDARTARAIADQLLVEPTRLVVHLGEIPPGEEGGKMARALLKQRPESYLMVVGILPDGEILTN